MNKGLKYTSYVAFSSLSSSSRFTTQPHAVARATTVGTSYRSAIFYTSDEVTGTADAHR
jgi:hypothetical protein